jgi:hypothetical protein
LHLRDEVIEVAIDVVLLEQIDYGGVALFGYQLQLGLLIRAEVLPETVDYLPTLLHLIHDCTLLLKFHRVYVSMDAI